MKEFSRPTVLNRNIQFKHMGPNWELHSLPVTCHCHHDHVVSQGVIPVKELPGPRALNGNNIRTHEMMPASCVMQTWTAGSGGSIRHSETRLSQKPMVWIPCTLTPQICPMRQTLRTWVSKLASDIPLKFRKISRNSGDTVTVHCRVLKGAR